MTGYKGLIGSFLLKKLREEGHVPALLIDEREGSFLKDLKNKIFNEKVDVVFHFASFCKINKCVEKPSLAFENNVLGTYSVLEFCRKNKIPKIIFTSSSRVLSKEKNSYTAGKIYGEELIKGYSQCYGIEYVIVRPSTVYGPFNDLSERLVDIFILNALQNKELKIFGDQNKTLDFTYIDDFIDGLLIVAKEKNKEFDLSSGESVKVSEVADFVISLAGKGKKVFDNPEISQPQQVSLDISPIRELGYLPKVRIQEGLKRTFEWYKSNLDEILKSRGK
jgi:UDP-glucose 4-epimerase